MSTFLIEKQSRVIRNAIFRTLNHLIANAIATEHTSDLIKLLAFNHEFAKILMEISPKFCEILACNHYDLCKLVVQMIPNDLDGALALVHTINQSEKECSILSVETFERHDIRATFFASVLFHELKSKKPKLCRFRSDIYHELIDLCAGNEIQLFQSIYSKLMVQIRLSDELSVPKKINTFALLCNCMFAKWTVMNGNLEMFQFLYKHNFETDEFMYRLAEERGHDNICNSIVKYRVLDLNHESDAVSMLAREIRMRKNKGTKETIAMQSVFEQSDLVRYMMSFLIGYEMKLIR